MKSPVQSSVPLLQAVSESIHVVGKDLGVNVLGHGDAAVTKLLHYLQIKGTFADQQTCAGVSQVVRCQAFEVRFSRGWEPDVPSEVR